MKKLLSILLILGMLLSLAPMAFASQEAENVHPQSDAEASDSSLEEGAIDEAETEASLPEGGVADEVGDEGRDPAEAEEAPTEESADEYAEAEEPFIEELTMDGEPTAPAPYSPPGDGRYRVKSITRTSGQTEIKSEFSYDKTGRLASIDYFSDGRDMSDGKCFSYDDEGRVVSGPWSDSRAQRFLYDEQGRLSYAYVFYDGGMGGAIEHEYAYDGEDYLISETRTYYYWDVLYGFTQGGSWKYSFSHSYDEAGNLIYTGRSDDGGSLVYSYDTQGRLLRGGEIDDEYYYNYVDTPCFTVCDRLSDSEYGYFRSAICQFYDAAGRPFYTLSMGGDSSESRPSSAHINAQAEYDEDGYLLQYSTSDYGTPVEWVFEYEPSNKCGNDLYWSYEDGALTITGTGDMWDWDNIEDVSWAEYREQITTVELDARTTSIGDRAFSGCSFLENGQWGEMDGLTRIGEAAFAGCKALTSIAIVPGVKSIGSWAFYNCTGLKTLYFFGSAPEFGEECFSCADKAVELSAYIPAGDTSWIGDSFPSSNRTIRWAAFDPIEGTSDRAFVESRDAWGFTNNPYKDPNGVHSYFVDYYYIDRDDFTTLLTNLSEVDKDAICFARGRLLDSILQEDKSMLDYEFLYDIDGNGHVLGGLPLSEWGGSCFGMSVTACLRAMGQLQIDINSSKEKNISLINYYYGQQYLKCYRYNHSSFYNLPEKEKIRTLESYAIDVDRTGQPFTISLYLSSGGGHEVVGYGMETGNYTVTINNTEVSFDKKILIYDCSLESNSLPNDADCDLYYKYLDNNRVVYGIPRHNLLCTSEIESGLALGDGVLGCVVSAYRGANDLNLIQYGTGKTVPDINVAATMIEYAISKGVTETEKVYIDFDSGTCTIDGKNLVYSDGELVPAILSSDGTGTSEAAIFLPYSSKYTLMCAAPLDYTVSFENNALTGASTDGGSMTVSENGGVSLTPDSAANCYIRLTANDSPLVWCTVEIDAKDTASLSAEFTDDGVLIEGEDLSGLTLSATDFFDSTTTEVNTEETSLLIKTESSTGELSVYADRDGNGAYETKLETASQGGKIPAPTVTLSDDGRTAWAENYDGLYARVALVLDNNGVSGLYVTQASINTDGAVVIPAFMVPGLTVRGVNVALVPTLEDIQSPMPNAVATASKML